MPSIDYQRVRAMVSIEQVLDLIRFQPNRRLRNELRGACPIHRSTSPRSRSFATNVSKNTFRCFSCGAAGNQLDLWAATTRQPLYQATIELCQRLGIDLPTRSTKTGQTRPPGSG